MASSGLLTLDSVALLAPEDPESLLIGDDPSINRIAHHHIASYLSIAPESLSRLRKKITPDF